MQHIKEGAEILQILERDPIIDPLHARVYIDTVVEEWLKKSMTYYYKGKILVRLTHQQETYWYDAARGFSDDEETVRAYVQQANYTDALRFSELLQEKGKIIRIKINDLPLHHALIQRDVYVQEWERLQTEHKLELWQ